MSDRCTRQRARRRWATVVLFAAAGVGFATAQLAGGQSIGSALSTLILFEAIAAVLALAGRSESVRAFRGDLRDERLDGIELRAVAFAGRLLLLALVVADVVQTVAGHGNPYAWLLGLGGASYVGYYAIALRR